jgi:MSHA pilin protein MshA
MPNHNNINERYFYMNKQQGGFTLIELVIVIIILGILAVAAMPKFINLQGDARASTLDGAKAAIQSANTLVYSKAAIAGLEKKGGDLVTERPSVSISDTVSVVTQYGYIQAEKDDLLKAVDFDGDQWILTGTNPVKVQQKGAPDTCFFNYTQPSGKNQLPKYSETPSATDC